MEYVKAIHLICVVCWFAGIFYLPRLFVYHAMADDQTGRDRFKTMERKLYRGIMTPMAVGTFVFGVWLVVANWSSYATAGWFWVKIGLVVALYGYHGFCGKLLRTFADDANTRTHTFYRWFNEAPLIILVAVTILVIAKPF